MKKMFLGLGASMFLLFVLSFHSLAGESNGNGSPQLNQSDPAGNVYQYQFQQSNPLNESGSGPSSETPPGARNGALDGTGPFLNIEEPTTVVGEVVACVQGGGLALAVDAAEPIYIFGIGPTWFWEVNEIERPALYDEITVEFVTVDNGETSRNVALSITYLYDDGSADTIKLRDEQGYPLWRLGRALKSGQASQTTP